MIAEVPSLLSILTEIPDHRETQGRQYPLAGLLTLLSVAMLCGYDNSNAVAAWEADYGEKYAEALGFEQYGYPSFMTWYRVLGGVDMS